MIKSIKEVIKRLLQDKIHAAALITVVIYLIAAIGIEVYSIRCHQKNITPVYDHDNMANSYQAPSRQHLFGTDYRGRDVLLRAGAGISTAVKVGLTASIISGVIGVTLGLLGGYFGGKIDDIVVWIYSTFASMPTMLFILAFALLATRGFLFSPLAKSFTACAEVFNIDPGMMAVYLAIGITGWVSLCRAVRGEAMQQRERAYVQAAKVLGLSNLRIIFRHVLPNVFHLVIIYSTLRFAYAIMTEVIVSYLGFGVQTAPSWGVMICDGQDRLWRGIWWEVGAATIFMFFLVLALNILGDALRDALDPKMKN
jgi:peptide/nickel transport system permease protein